MTPAQLQTLKAYILATPELAAIATGPSTDYGTLGNMLSAPFSPTFTVWRSSLPVSEVLNGFIAADWTAMDNLSVGQDRIWINLKEVGTLNPSSVAHRAALEECWKGTAAKVAVKDRILAMGKRDANVAEKVLATGTGTVNDPATMTFEGTVSVFDVAEIMSV